MCIKKFWYKKCRKCLNLLLENAHELTSIHLFSASDPARGGSRSAEVLQRRINIGVCTAPLLWGTKSWTRAPRVHVYVPETAITNSGSQCKLSLGNLIGAQTSADVTLSVTSSSCGCWLPAREQAMSPPHLPSLWRRSGRSIILNKSSHKAVLWASFPLPRRCSCPSGSS